MSIDVLALLTAMLVMATPLLFAGLGELMIERTGILNLGIEGTMYGGAFAGYFITMQAGSPWIGLLGAIVLGIIVGALTGVFMVTLGVNQHVVGIGMTLILIGISEFVNRLNYSGSHTGIEKFSLLFKDVPIFEQYLLTYIALIALCPLAWWALRRTGWGMRIRAVGENPEAADAAGISVTRVRYTTLMLGAALMSVGGAFITLAMLGTFTLDITSGRGWVAIALVIFARWRVWPMVIGALLFAGIDALQLQLAVTPMFADVPREIMIALPYLVVIVALAISGKNLRYPGAYLKPYVRT